MIHIDWDAVITAILGALGGGGVVAFFGRKKSAAETKLVSAQADQIVWTHMLETIELMQTDIAELKKGILKCEEREVTLLQQIAGLIRQINERS